MEDHKVAVKSFADETLNSTWSPFLMNVLKSKIPSLPPEAQESEDAEQTEFYRGSVALKLQALKVRSFFDLNI